MTDKEINIDHEYEYMLDTLRKQNDEAVIRIHARSMKIAFVFGLALAVSLTEKLGECSYDETEEIKDSVDRQAEEFFADLEHGMYIEEVMNDINTTNNRADRMSIILGVAVLLFLIAYILCS